MPDMKLIGPVERAKLVRAAAVRFRREVDYALGIMPGAPPTTSHSLGEVSASLPELAEALAVLRHVLRAVDTHGMSTERDRERLRTELLAWESYHEVAR